MTEVKDHFPLSELACKCCGVVHVDPDLKPALERVRAIYRKPMVVTSGYRCEKHNAAVGGGLEHPRGRAADIGVENGWQVFLLVEAAMKAGIVRIGVNSKKNEKGEPMYYVHIGIDESLPCWLWTY